MNRMLILTLCTAFVFITTAVRAVERVPVKIEKHVEGAPITLGIPIPKGTLYSPDHVRLLNSKGKEIPSQITEVSTWLPLDKSIKWMWVFFFADAQDTYTIEYGNDVVRAPYEGERVIIRNNQRETTLTEVNTGPLNFKIRKDLGGFFETIQLDTDKNGFDDKDIIAEGTKERGSFLDILDAAGIDKSKAIITRSVKELGTGPLHGIIRLEGEYYYSRSDNNPSPFVMRIHVYAGKSYVKVLHTLTYTGVPDLHEPLVGEHPSVATQAVSVIKEYNTKDKGWTKPNDQIAATGFSLKYNLTGKLTYKIGYKDGEWWENNDEKIFELKAAPIKSLSLLQNGPKPNRQEPVPVSSPTERIKGFSATLSADNKVQLEKAKASGWMDISDEKWGIGIGMRKFFEEYPKQLSIDPAKSTAIAYLWSPDAGPMSFARDNSEMDADMLDNFAQGLAKTSELVYYFHKADVKTNQVQQTVNYILNPPIAHASPDWYAKSGAFNLFSPRGNSFGEYERGLDYKFDWMLFNQNWTPWYGMFEYGDFRAYYIDNKWQMWANNEPAQDYMLWMQFMRTGDPKFYVAAEANSRHTMDVDNIHWPKKKTYYGDTNPAVDYFAQKDAPNTSTPYLGIGRRHAEQHWTAILSAHVWVPGWLTSYYLTGYHRGLEIAKQTADTYCNRIWGEHDLTGRRLYLSVWNMTEVYDATKDPRYFADLQDRVDQMLALQNGTEQYHSLVIDRYGYSQVYASQGLRKFYSITGDEKVKDALVKHARALRDIPPMNHQFESYLSSIHSLLVGYEFTKDKSYLNAALERAKVIKTEQSEVNFDNKATQETLANALLNVSHLPPDPDNKDAEWDVRNGLRVFGWTHFYSVPTLLYFLRNQKVKGKK
jgi:hypothetical protein